MSLIRVAIESQFAVNKINSLVLNFLNFLFHIFINYVNNYSFLFLFDATRSPA